jgi:hypothetical protein
MPMINCYIDDDIYWVLLAAAQATERKLEELAEAAIENAAIEYKVNNLAGYKKPAA